MRFPYVEYVVNSFIVFSAVPPTMLSYLRGVLTGFRFSTGMASYRASVRKGGRRREHSRTSILATAVPVTQFAR